MIRFRLYWDKDAEEKWLNEMAARGYMMQRFFLGIYWFCDCQPGEYLFQIDLLNDSEPEKKKEYIQIIEDSGAYMAGRWFWWYYFYKRASAGKFELYTDVESKINQYSRIYHFFRGVAFLETGAFIFELVIFLISINDINFSRGGTVLSASACLLIGLIAAVFWNICRKVKIKVKKLEKEIL